MKMRILGKRAGLKSRRSASGRIDLRHGLGPTREGIRLRVALDRGVTCFDTDLCVADVESNCDDLAEIEAALAKIEFVDDCHPAHLQPSIRR